MNEWLSYFREFGSMAGDAPPNTTTIAGWIKISIGEDYGWIPYYKDP